MDYSPPGSSVHGILQVRILEWVPFPSLGDLLDPGIKPRSPALWADSLSTEPQGSHFSKKTANNKNTLISSFKPALGYNVAADPQITEQTEYGNCASVQPGSHLACGNQRCPSPPPAHLPSQYMKGRETFHFQPNFLLFLLWNTFSMKPWWKTGTGCHSTPNIPFITFIREDKH